MFEFGIYAAVSGLLSWRCVSRTVERELLACKEEVADRSAGTCCSITDFDLPSKGCCILAGYSPSGCDLDRLLLL